MQEKIQKIRKYRETVFEADYKVGETVENEVSSESSDIIGENLLNIFLNCKTEEEFQIANAVLKAISSCEIETILDIVNERDGYGYVWPLLD